MGAPWECHLYDVLGKSSAVICVILDAENPVFFMCLRAKTRLIQDQRYLVLVVNKLRVGLHCGIVSFKPSDLCEHSY